MPELTLEFFINALTGQQPASQTPLTGVFFDSRQVEPGAMFVALPGEGGDGHRYVASAFANGAAVAIIDQDVDTDKPIIALDALPLALPETPFCLQVDDALHVLQETSRRWFEQWAALSDRRTIAITGSVGKTTTKEVVATVLAEKHNTLKSEKSYNNEIGVPLTLLQLRDEHERAVLEMSMYFPGEIKLLIGFAQPDVGLVTNIRPVHLERALTLERIVDAKAELVEGLLPDGVALLNADDELTMTLQDRTPARQVVTYGTVAGADVRADNIETLGLAGVRFTLHYQGASRVITFTLPGEHSVYTALCAAAVGFVEGLSWDQVAAGLERQHQPVRLIPVEGPRGSTLLDDTYNASPDAVIAALNLLQDLPGQHIAVLGDMLELGSYEQEGHRRVGEHAAATVDYLVTVGERGKIIAQAARDGGLPAEMISACADAEAATVQVLAWLEQGGALLVKGSRAVGMERVVSALLTEVNNEGAAG